MTSISGGAAFAAVEGECLPLSSKSLHFSGSYKENGSIYQDTLAVEGHIFKLISLNKNKPFGILFPVKATECTDNCNIILHLENSDISLPISDKARICWTYYSDCVLSGKIDCSITEINSSFILKLEKYNLEFADKKLSYHKNSLKLKNYSNTSFYEIDQIPDGHVHQGGKIYKKLDEIVEIDLKSTK